MNEDSKKLFAERVAERLTEFDQEQKNYVKSAILEEMDDYIVYTPEEAAEIIKEPLEFLDRFLKVKRYEGLSSATIKLYKLNITHFIGNTVKKVVEIDAEDIRSYLNRKVMNGASLAYANQIRSNLSSFFTWMFDEEYIERNPIRKVNKIKCERQLQPAFNEIEIDALRRAASDDRRELAMVDFLLSTGCRVSEVCNADISDVNFEKKKLCVVGKGSKKRVVYLTDVAVCSLKAYLRSRNDDEPALFIGHRKPHARMTPKSIQNLLKKIGKAAHVENVHPHRFRHTSCTRLLCRGMAIQDVSRILGHADVKTTMWYNNTSDDYVDSKFRIYSF